MRQREIRYIPRDCSDCLRLVEALRATNGVPGAKAALVLMTRAATTRLNFMVLACVEISL